MCDLDLELGEFCHLFEIELRGRTVNDIFDSQGVFSENSIHELFNFAVLPRGEQSLENFRVRSNFRRNCDFEFLNQLRIVDFHPVIIGVHSERSLLPLILTQNICHDLKLHA